MIPCSWAWWTASAAERRTSISCFSVTDLSFHQSDIGLPWMSSIARKRRPWMTPAS